MAADKNLELALKIKAELEQARRSLDQLSGNIDQVGNSSDKTDKKMGGMGRTIRRVATVAAAAFAAQKVLRIADDYGALQNRLRLVTDSQGELAAVTRQVFEISQKTSSAMDATATIYQRFAQNGEALNISQAETARLTEIVAKSIAITGGSAASAEAALTQFGQALSSGVLRGDEFRSISEQAQGLRDALAKGLGIGIGELKKLADAGGLTADVLVKALLAAEDFVDEKFDTRVKLLSQAMVELDNSVTFLVGDTVTATGVTNDLADSISGLAEILQDPGTKAAFQGIIDLLAGLAGGAIGLAGEIGRVGIALSEQVDIIKGTLPELERIDSTLAGIERRRQGPLVGPVAFLFSSDAELDALEAQLKAEREIIQARRDATKGGATGAAGGAPDPLEPPPVVNKEFDKALAGLQKQRDLFGVVSEAAKVRYAIEQGELGKLDSAQQALLLKYAKQIDTKAADTKRSKEAAAAADSLASSQRAYVDGLERQAATLGLNAAQVRAYELAEKGLAGAMLERAQAAAAAINADEAKRQADQDAATLAGIRAGLLRNQGQEAEALSIELEQQFGELNERLQAEGNVAGVALINQLFNVQLARARMDELQGEIGRVFAEQGRTEQSIQTQLQAGLISEIAARQQLVELHARTAAEIEKLLPTMRELAAATGDPAALQRVRDLEAELGRLKTTTDETALALKKGFEESIGGALEGLATRTLTLREAVEEMGRDLARTLARIAAQNIANSIATKVFGGGKGSAELVTGAAAVTASATALGVAGGTLTTGAAAIQKAAISLAAASGASAAGAGASAAGSAAGDAGFLKSVMGFFGFAEGGQVRGPGGPVGDKIPAWLSDKEFVTRSAVTGQPGALSFLYDFNRRGMAALNDYALRIGHNTGGLAGVPAPAFPAPAPVSQGLAPSGNSVSINQKFVMVDDPARIADAMSGPAGEEVSLLHLSRNPAKVRQILKLNN